MKVKAIIHKAEEGGYWAEVPVFPGCVTQGETFDEVTDNLREAVAGWLSVERILKGEMTAGPGPESLYLSAN
jgi:predicted RNase H-like HicB family nuclease